METLEKTQVCEKECRILEEMSHTKGQRKKNAQLEAGRMNTECADMLENVTKLMKKRKDTISPN